MDAAYHEATFARDKCALLIIDGVGIEQWLAVHLNHADVSRYGLSLLWLLYDEEDALVKRRFIPGADGSSTIVPLLVFNEDMDFDNTTLVTEQVIKGDTVHWVRFGWSVSDGLKVGISTRWNAGGEPVSFALDEFRAALEKLDELIETHVPNR
ncbi:hypothetical protein GIB57_07130 [Pseudomonas tremae]|nr:hypothetical protein [Pseudomonas tremae]MCF5744267.1 hypothetical protein [Pseudomonas tremae]UQB34379.1 hypothetical protein I9H06_21410 [Pseudomonas tremae]UQB39411.1 hypothetical protein I9H09_20530 [Pseudomonas tremae]